MNSVSKVILDNKDCSIITIIEENIEVSFMDYGATILSLKTPNKDGILEDILMSYEKLDSFVENSCYLNAIVGPIAGRIKNAEYTINNKQYQLDKNFLASENLHSGHEGISFKVFNYSIIEEDKQTKVIFTYRKEERNSSFPGNVDIEIIYTVKENELLIEFKGETDQDTLLNLTNHAYFNLSGNLKNTILNHELLIKASNVMTLDDHNVPIGVESLADTFLDFRNNKVIKDNFYDGIEYSNTAGIDHPYILDTVDFNISQATLFDSESKRKMDVYTSYPSIVVYTHNFPDDRQLGHNKKTEKHLAICFETQNHPNGINIPNVESSILRKNENYYHKTLYKFSVKEG